MTSFTGGNMYILGVNSAYHESSACLIKEGKIVAAVEEERFNRVKHAKQARVDNPDELPVNAIQYCLEKAGISLEDIAYIGYSLNPEERLQRNIQHKHPYDPSPKDFGTQEGEETFYQKNLEVKKKLRQQGFNGEFHFLNHHDCHAASSFFVSPYNAAGVLVVDGIGEFESTTLYKGQDNKLEKLESIDFPNSLGFLWEKISKYLGFSEYDAAKVMGLTSYGNPNVYRDQFNDLVNVNQNRTFTIDDSVIQFRNEDYSSLEDLFGFEKRNKPVRDVDRNTKKYADVAASLQEVTEKIILNLSKYVKTKSENLCLSGGVALNCVANGKLLEGKIFDSVFIQPAANDAGTAIGAAYYIWNQLLENPRTYVMENAYLGPSFSNKEIQEELDQRGLDYTRHDNIGQVAAQLISKGNIVAWFQGKMEVGPRTLGNRSILADPRKEDAVSLLNHKIKHREPFRPFCPSVLEDKAAEWFDVEELFDPYKYMLATCDVLDHRKVEIPAVIHVDGTSRTQKVKEQDNPKYYALIEAFENITGVPIVLNTSFNNQEPIVCSPEDAINTFLGTKIDYLAIGDFLVSRGEENE